jgi:hypothetical protein
MSLKSFFDKLEIDLSFDQGCIKMRKSEAGDYFLLCQYSNRWRDRDAWSHPEKGGEIITTDAHERYMRWLDENPNKAPELWSLHIPGTQRKNIAHWWGFDGSFAFAEFKLSAEEAVGIKRFVSIYKAGLSHGFFVLKYDFNEGLIEEYITYEISILPVEMAANQWTNIELIQKELASNMYLRPEQRAALVTLHGEDYVKELETKSQEFASMLDKVGIDSKALKTAVQSDVDERLAKKEEVVAPVATEAGVTPAALETLQNDILGALQRLYDTMTLDMKKLQERIDAQAKQIKGLEEQVEIIEEEDEEKVAAKTAAAPKSLFANWLPSSVVGNETTLVTGRDQKTKGPKQSTVATNGHMLSGMFGGLRNEE